MAQAVPLTGAPGGRVPLLLQRGRAEGHNAHHGERHAQEPYQGPVTLQVRRHHQTESAEEGVEGRDGAGQVYSTTGPVGISPRPSQQCVAAIHDPGMNTATRANRALTPRKRSRITSVLSVFVVASHPWPSSSCTLGLPTRIEYGLVDRRKMRIGGTDGLRRNLGRSHP